MLKGKVSGAQPLRGKAIPRGMDGVSPVVGIEDIEGGYRLTITDISSTKSIDLMHGKQGDPGKDGKDLTEEDKADIVSAVLNSLPVYNGEVVSV